MNRFTEEQLDEARRRWDVVISALGPVKRAGREIAARCPFHAEKTPSFFVIPDKGFFHCFGCGSHGTAIDFIMRARGLNFTEAVHELLDLEPQHTATALPPPRQVEREDRRQDAIAEILAGCGQVAPGTAAHMYLQMRGLSRPQPALLAHHGLDYVEEADGPGDERPPWRRWFSERLQCWRRSAKLPALIAPSTNSRGEITALMRIWLVDKVIYDGTTPAPKDNRAPVRTRKQSIGTFGDGAVQLQPPGVLLGLAEGVETAIAASDAYGYPVWAICGTSRLGFPEHYRERRPVLGKAPEMWIAPAMPPRDFDAVHVAPRTPTVWIPPEVRKLVIFGDNGIGEIIARHAAQAYRRKLDVMTAAQLPPAGFSDFNDEHLAEPPR